MTTDSEMIEEAVRAGKVTVYPPRQAAGRKKKKVMKGERARPCRRCREPVRYIKSTWTAFAKRRRGWHWVNEDGTHHRCSDFRAVIHEPICKAI